jgi:endonuclease YncB( thermonuclease family)
MSQSWPPRARRRYFSPPRSRQRRLVDYALTVIILGLLLLLASRLDRIETRRAQGAAYVIDGDTLALGAQRIRMRGIDAPEASQVCHRNGAEYPCGSLSRQSLIGLIAGDPVSCTGWQHDRYGRLLGDCMAGGKDLSRAQVKAGWAIAYGDYDGEEAVARAGRSGLWAGSFDRPQDWRDRHHGQVAERRHGTIASIGDAIREILRIW